MKMIETSDKTKIRPKVGWRAFSTKSWRGNDAQPTEEDSPKVHEMKPHAGGLC